MPFVNGKWVAPSYEWPSQVLKQSQQMTPDEQARRTAGNQMDNYIQSQQAAHLADIAQEAEPTDDEAARLRNVPAMQQAEFSQDHPFLALQKGIYDNTIGPLSDFINRIAASGAKSLSMDTVDNALQQNQYLPTDIQNALKPAQTTSQQAADLIGQGIGFIGPGEAAYKTGGEVALKGLERLAPNAPQIVSDLVRGAGAGLTYGTADQALDAGFDTHNDGSQSLGQRLANIGLDTAMFGGGDAAFNAIGRGLANTQLAKNFQLSNAIRNSEPLDNSALYDMNNRTPLSVDNPNFVTNQDLFPDVQQPQSKYDLNSVLDMVKNKQPEPLNLTEDLNSIFGKNEPSVTPYADEFNQSLQDEFNRLRDIRNNPPGMLDKGGLLTDTSDVPFQNGEITGSFKPTSGNPQWYRDFYKDMGRKPTNNELMQIAKDNLLNGEKDSFFGDSLAWKPQAAQELEGQMNEISQLIQQEKDPATIDALGKTLDSLQQEHDNIMAEARNQIEGNTQTPVQKLVNDLQVANNNAARGPIRTREPIPIKETAATAEINPSEIPDTSTHIVSKTDKPTLKQAISNTPSKINQSYINTMDNLYRLKQFQDVADKIEPLKPSEQPYTLALNSRGSDMVASQIINKNMVNPKGEVIGKSYGDIIKQIPKGEERAFEDYLVNRHAETRMNRGEDVFPKEMNMTPEKSKQIVNNYEQQYPHFKDIAKQYDEYHDQLAKSWLVEPGLITPEQYAKWKEENPYYTPNQRLFDDIERKGYNRAKGGFINQTNPVKKATGSQRRIISPIESDLENTEKYVKTAKRNEVGQAILNILERNPEELQGFAEVMHDSNKMDVQKVLNEEGIDGLLNKLEEPISKNDPVKGSVVTVMRDGKPVKIKIHDMQLLDAVSALQPKAQNAVISALGKLTKTMKVLTTGVNPVFSLTRNVFRDIPTAYVNSKTTMNPLKFAWDLGDAFVSVLGNKELYQSYKNIGGGHSSSVASDRNLLAQSKNKILHQAGLINNTKKGAEKILHMLENLNNAVESAPRLAEFKRAAKDGTYDSKIKGLYEANDVTVNFNRYGKMAKDADAVIPYLNASLQGLDKFFRAYKDNPVKATIKSFGAITVPTILLYVLNHDNPNYQALSNYEKDNYLNIPLPDGTFYKIPKPREIGAPFSSLAERVFRMWFEHDPHAFKDFATTVKNTFFPPTSDILQPFADIRANKDFADNPIVSGELQKLSPALQYDQKTSELAKKVGALTDQSPKQIDYLIKSYSGILGQVGIPANTQNNNLLDVLKQQVVADPAYSTDSIRNFYDEKNKLDTARQDFNHTRIKSDDLNEPLRKEFDQAATQLSQIRKQILLVQNSTTLSSDDKKAKARELQMKMNNVANRMNSLVK